MNLPLFFVIYYIKWRVYLVWAGQNKQFEDLTLGSGTVAWNGGMSKIKMPLWEVMIS